MFMRSSLNGLSRSPCDGNVIANKEVDTSFCICGCSTVVAEV